MVELANTSADPAAIQQHINVSTVVVLQGQAGVRHTIRSIRANREIPEAFDSTDVGDFSGLRGNSQDNAVQVVLPFYLASEPRICLQFAALALKRCNLEIRLRTELTEPGLFDKNVASGALTGAAAQRLYRQAGLLYNFHQAGALACLEFVLRAVTVGSKYLCQRGL